MWCVLVYAAIYITVYPGMAAAIIHIISLQALDYTSFIREVFRVLSPQVYGEI